MIQCMGMVGGHGSMMWVMGGVGLLVVALLLLGIATLVEFLIFGRGGRAE